MSRATGPIVEVGASALQIAGRELLGAFYAAAQSLKLFPLENATVQKALSELHRVAARLLERDGGIELRLVGDFFFLNETRLRLDFSNYIAFSFLASALNRHEIGSIEVVPGVAREEWAPFLAILMRDPAPESPFQRFLERLAESPVKHILADAPRESDRILDESEDAREMARRTYFQGVHVAKEAMTAVRLGRAINVRRVKRAVQSIVDQVLNNETAILGMTTLRDYDEYTFTHSVNVCIFSVVIGQKIGLTLPQLYELGLAALFHDIGKTRLDPAITRKETVLSDEEFAAVMEHPIDGMILLFSVPGFVEAPYRAMLVAYEHHMKVDLTGYPKSRRPRHLSLFSRIVAIADGFDAGTSRRSYQPMPSSPDEVLAEMINNPARGYDPLLVKAFLNVTGIYPIGTLVILDTFELAVVVAANPDPQRLHQPIVKILADPFGLALPEPIIVDLSELDPETGAPRRSIIKTTDPEKYGIRISDYFI